MKFSLLCQRYLFSLKKRLLLNYGSSWEGFQKFCQISNLMGGYVSVAGLCLFYEWRMKFLFVVIRNQDYQIEEKNSSKKKQKIVYVWGSIVSGITWAPGGAKRWKRKEDLYWSILNCSCLSQKLLKRIPWRKGSLMSSQTITNALWKTHAVIKSHSNVCIGAVPDHCTLGKCTECHHPAHPDNLISGQSEASAVLSGEAFGVSPVLFTSHTSQFPDTEKWNLNTIVQRSWCEGKRKVSHGAVCMPCNKKKSQSWHW